MNNISLLVLGLVTFILSSVPAAYAKDNLAEEIPNIPHDSILQFDPPLHASSSWSAFPQPTVKPANSDRAESQIEHEKFNTNSQVPTLEFDKLSSPSAVGNLESPTLEFEAPGLDLAETSTPAISTSEVSTPETNTANLNTPEIDIYQSSTPELTPFHLPEGLDDSDLFEQDSSEIDSSYTHSIVSRSVTHTVPSPEPSLIFERVPESDLTPKPQETPSTIAHSDQVSANQSSSAVSDSSNRSIGLDFTLRPAVAPSSTPSTASASPASPAPPVAPQLAKSIAEGSLDALFTGDSDSLVARTVGSAEGTRSVDGSKNPAYYGHTDPGNGVWNLGSFSYQHGATSPEEADAKQLARLRQQAETMLEKAAAQGMNLTLEEKLNGIDLANQAPKAVLDKQGYIDWLAEAHGKGMSGADAILWARVQSFIDPYTQTWNAPGLGNTEESISHDQNRRMLAIAKALATYLQEMANGSPANSATNNQVSDRSLSEEEGIARLLAQPMTRLFDWAGSLASNVADRSSESESFSESISVRQLFALDLERTVETLQP